MQRKLTYKGWDYTIDFEPITGKEMRRLKSSFAIAEGLVDYNQLVSAEFQIHETCLARITSLTGEKTDKAQDEAFSGSGRHLLDTCEDNEFVVALVNEIKRPLSEDERKNFEKPRG